MKIIRKNINIVVVFKEKTVMINPSAQIHSTNITENSQFAQNYQTSPFGLENEIISDEYNISNASRLASSSCATKINSYEDYKRMSDPQNLQTEKNLWKEYQDFLKIRGCSNKLELIALNLTGLSNTETLKLSAAKQMYEIFDDMNIDIGDFDIETFVEGSFIEDIADFFNNMKKSQGSLDELYSLKDFLETGLDNLNFDRSFQSSLSELLEHLDDTIDFLEKKRI